MRIKQDHLSGEKSRKHQFHKPAGDSTSINVGYDGFYKIQSKLSNHYISGLLDSDYSPVLFRDEPVIRRKCTECMEDEDSRSGTIEDRINLRHKSSSQNLISRCENETAEDETEEEPVMTREEEIELSYNSPGQITGVSNPPVITLYNFANDEHQLKQEHIDAINELNTLFQNAGSDHFRLRIIGHKERHFSC